MSAKHKQVPQASPQPNEKPDQNECTTPPSENRLGNRKRTGLVAVTGALTATTAIAGALAVGDGGSTAGEPAAAMTTPAVSAGATTEDLLADRQAARAARGVARPALPAKPKPAPTAKRAPKPRPESVAAPARRVIKKPRTIRASSAGRTCGASFYSEGQQTASGERFNPNALTAAHKTLPLDSRVQVTNLANGDSVVVRINDRGPYVGGRCLDLSRAAFGQIASLSSGHIQVRYRVL